MKKLTTILLLFCALSSAAQFDITIREARLDTVEARNDSIYFRGGAITSDFEPWFEGKRLTNWIAEIGSGVTYGTDGQMPFVNPAGDGFLYDPEIRRTPSGAVEFNNLYVGATGQSPYIINQSTSSIVTNGSISFVGISGGVSARKTARDGDSFNFNSTYGFSGNNYIGSDFSVNTTGASVDDTLYTTMVSLNNSIQFNNGINYGNAFEYNYFDTTKFFIDLEGVANYGGVNDTLLTDSSLAPKRYVDTEMATLITNTTQTADLADTWYSATAGTFLGNKSDGIELIDAGGYVDFVINFDGYATFSGKATLNYNGTANSVEGAQFRILKNGVEDEKFRSSINRTFNTNTYYEVVSWVAALPVSAGDTLSFEFQVTDTDLILDGRNGDPAFGIYIKEEKVKEQTTVNFTPII